MRREHVHGQPRSAKPIRKLLILVTVIIGATIVVLFVPILPVNEMRDLVDRAGRWDSWPGTQP